MVKPALRREVEEVLALLAEDAGLDDLIYALELRADIRAGLADAEAGRVVDQVTVRRQFGLT
jgi:predicted transcriptional regulator